MVGMLLACLPYLKTLGLSAGVPSRCVPASALRAAGVSSLPIETLDIAGCDYKSGRRLDGILELASSTIRTLNVDISDGEGLLSLG
jgi:hypothetical protein